MAKSLRGQTYRSRHIVICFTWPRAGISAVGPGFYGVFCEYFFGMMALHGTSVGKTCITASSDLTNLVPTGMYRVITCMFGSSYSIFQLNKLRLSHFRYALEYGVLLMDLNIDRLALRCFNTVSWHSSTCQTVCSLRLMIMLGTVAFVLGLYKVILDESSYTALPRVEDEFLVQVHHSGKIGVPFLQVFERPVDESQEENAKPLRWKAFTVGLWDEGQTICATPAMKICSAFKRPI